MQIFAGLFTEGTTDLRFFESIVRRAMEKVAFECRGQIDVYVTSITDKPEGDRYPEQVLSIARIAHQKYGLQLVCLHADADSQDSRSVMQHKFQPALDKIQRTSDEEVCRNIVPIIPVQMMEAWMLADKELLRKEIGTTLSDNLLGINRFPEDIADPKKVIMDAILLARAPYTKKRRKDLKVADLYLPIGEKLALSKLEALPSYQSFQTALRQCFRDLRLL